MSDELDFDSIVIGRPPSRWRDFLTRLSDWLHPDQRFMHRHMPRDPVARELVLLLFTSADRMSDHDRQELLADVRRRLGIKPIKTRRLPYVGPEDDA